MQPGYITRQFVDAGLLGDEYFRLIDVGCSGGLDPAWGYLGPALRAVAFDPLISEIERLRASHSLDGAIEYIDAFITGPKKASSSASVSVNDLFELPAYARSSAAYARLLAKEDFVKEHQNSNQELRFSENFLTIDAFCQERNLTNIDFLKIDTDGFDLPVVRGAYETLRNRNVLGVMVEMQFQGAPTPDANVFSNIDPLLREAGFTLFDLAPNRYSKSALPGKFRYNLTAQTLNGQVVWSDALYLRDFADPAFTSWFPHVQVNRSMLVKMLILFELFGFFDCAVELLQTYATVFAESMDITGLSHAFAQRAGVSDYAAYMARFEELARKREYAKFPDGRIIYAEGFLDQNVADPESYRFVKK